MKKQLALWIVLLFVMGTAVPGLAQSGTEVPEDYRKLPDLHIFTDERMGQWAGAGNGMILDTVEADGQSGLPIDEKETYGDLPSYRVQVSEQDGWWAFILAGNDWESYSIAPYNPGGYLEFNVKGAEGLEDFVIALNDIDVGRNPENVSSEEVTMSTILEISDKWQHVKIPLQTFLASSANFNPNQMFSIRFSNANGSAMTFWLNDIKFTSPNDEPGHPEIKLNQLGYLPEAQKIARISGFGQELIAQVETPFEIRNLHNNEIVYQGVLELATDFDAVVSGERVLIADFSPLTLPGNYYLAVSAHRMEDSPAFMVGGDVYDGLLADSLRYFYLQRSGLPLEADYAGQFARTVGHAQDAKAEFRSGINPARDVSGGWYDAGDYGKYVNAGAAAISDLLWAYEMFPDQFEDGDLNIPESGNGIPDLLDEVRWELDWILKMQDPDSGGFYHKVQPTEDGPIQKAQGTRYIEDVDGDRENVRPTSTTGSAVAALAHAAYVFEAVDPIYAEQLLMAAESGWAYLDANPEGVASIPGPYNDEEDSDDRFWAATALYRVTGDDVYHDVIKQLYGDVETYFDTETDNAYGVGGMGMVAWLLYANSDDPDSELMTYFEELFRDWSARMKVRWQDSVWDLAMLDEDFYWGSNYVTLTTPLVMLVGSEALGELDETAVKMSQDALNYLLGTNPMSFSYISGYGENSLQNPLSKHWSNDGISDIPDGVMSGGPNAYSNPLMFSNFAGKRYVDSAASWTTNEHTVYWNSTLVFHTALANRLGQDQAIDIGHGVIEWILTPTPLPAASSEIADINTEEVSDEISDAVVPPESPDEGPTDEAYRVVVEESAVELKPVLTNIYVAIVGLIIVMFLILLVLLLATVIVWRSLRQTKKDESINSIEPQDAPEPPNSFEIRSPLEPENSIEPQDALEQQNSFETPDPHET